MNNKINEVSYSKINLILLDLLYLLKNIFKEYFLSLYSYAI